MGRKAGRTIRNAGHGAPRGSRCYGAWDFASMIILVKGGRFCARLDFNHTFGPHQAGFRQRFGLQCEVEVLWT